MTVLRMMGTETEYAISAQGAEHYDPVRLSFDVVAAAANESTSRIRWDYRQEDPLNDARGTHLPRAAARPEMLTDEPQRRIVNVIASNGGRVYVDHAHPEYSAPETLDPFEAVRYDHAGDRIMLEAVRKANRARPEDSHIVLYRNNVDGKGASWGTHENYMMLRDVPFDRIVALMTLHFVTRQIYTGSGRVGLGEHSEMAGFQLSQRADYIHSKVGLQTTFDRPIVNARDESHVTRDERRLHVIVGDANRMDVPQALKLGTTSMLLWLLEQQCDSSLATATAASGFADGQASPGSIPVIPVDDLAAEFRFADAVDAMHQVSHDLTLAGSVALESGRTATAWQIQVRLLTAVAAQGAVAYGTDSRGDPLWPDEQTRRIMAMWRQALSDVATVRHADDEQRLNMTEQASRLEWLLKWQLCERFRRRTGVKWGDIRLAALDLGWGSLDPATSIYGKVQSQAERLDVESGLPVQTVAQGGLTDSPSGASGSGQKNGQTLNQKEAIARAGQDVVQATREAPRDTRAWLRAELLNRFPHDIVAMSWSHITVRDYSRHPHGMLCLDISDPLLWTEERCRPVIISAVEEGLSAAQTLGRLSRLGGQ